jgi:hypothetical protein
MILLQWSNENSHNYICINLLYIVFVFVYFYFFSALTKHNSTVKLRFLLRTNGIFYCVYVIIFQYFTLYDDGSLQKPKHVAMKYTVN